MGSNVTAAGGREHQDLRIRRTRKALWDALIDLVVEKGLHAITITDITRRAMVNRSTLYAHVEHKGGLLNQGISDRLDDLLAEMPIAPDGAGRRTVRSTFQLGVQAPF